MSDTRPSGRPIIDAASAAVSQDVVQVDAQRRLNLRPRWTNRFPWLSGTKSSPAKVLMILVEPGKIKLAPWEPNGPRIESRYEEIAQNALDESSLETLRLIQDRYVPLSIDEEHRPYLGDAALAHLGLPLERGIKSTVYVVVYPESLAILSTDYRDKMNLLGSNDLDDLP